MQVQQEALKRALQLLRASGCQFAVLDADGTKHGALEVVEPRTRAAMRFPRGTITSHFQPFVKTMAAGDAKVIPFGLFDTDDRSKEQLRNSISSWASSEWGNGSYITALQPAGVEILRVE